MSVSKTTKTLAIVPARGLSKGVHRKNLASLNDKPLLGYTLDEVFKSEYVNRVVVSTEDDEIARFSLEAGAEIPFMRPIHLSQDSVHSVHVILHALGWLKEHENYNPDIVVMLLPTSPFRTSTQIDEAIKVFTKGGCHSVVSVALSSKQVPHFRKIDDGFLKPVVDIEICEVQRQDTSPLYVLNGSIYVSNPVYLQISRSFHTAKTRPYIMDRYSSMDINSVADLEEANQMLALGIV